MPGNPAIFSLRPVGQKNINFVYWKRNSYYWRVLVHSSSSLWTEGISLGKIWTKIFPGIQWWHGKIMEDDISGLWYFLDLSQMSLHLVYNIFDISPIKLHADNRQTLTLSQPAISTNEQTAFSHLTSNAFLIGPTFMSSTHSECFTLKK